MGVIWPPNPTAGQIVTDSVTNAQWVYDPPKWNPAGSSIAPLSIDGGNMLGPLGLVGPAQSPTQATQAGDIPSWSQGFVNKLRNGTFDVWQRGPSINVPAATSPYTADGWQILASGAAVSVSQGTTQIGLSATSLTMNGVAGNTGVTLLPKIESYISAPLAGKTCTFQIVILNATGATITPTLSTFTPPSVDGWSNTIPDLATVNLQPCPNGVATKVAYTFNVGTNALLGYMLYLGFPVLGANVIAVADADFRATPGWPVGLCANPPPPELRPIGVELPFCQRYYEQSDNPQEVWSGNVISGISYYYVTYYQVAKRTYPTVQISYASASGFPTTAPTINNANSVKLCRVSNIANSTYNGGYYQYGWTASAEL